MRSLVPLGFMFAFVANVAAGFSNAQAREAVDETLYRSFFTTQDRDERIRLFNALSAEQRAALMNTHVRRWLVANLDALSGEQIAVIGEALTVLTPALYQKPNDAATTAKLATVSQRAEALLGPVRAAQVFRIQGPYVPPAK